MIPHLSSQVRRSAILKHVVAKRVLVRQDAPERPVEIEIGVPRKRSASEWRCAFVLRGLDDDRVQTAYGVDALQAFLFAIAKARVQLKESKVALNWLGGPEWSGLPRFVPTEYGIQFEDRIDCLMEREAKNIASKQLKRQKAEIASAEARLNAQKRVVGMKESNLRSWNAQLQSQTRRKTASLSSKPR